MKLFTLIGVEFTKIRRSRIAPLLMIPVIVMWLPSVIHADKNFYINYGPISPEHNFFIQGFMGMTWFMFPATLIICTVLLSQTERGNHGILKMLALPVSKTMLNLAKFIVILLLDALQMIFTIAVYYVCAFLASRFQDYSLFLDPLYVISMVGKLYLTTIPMASLFWMFTVLIPTPVFSMGIGLASIVPSVLIINTKAWCFYPMCYPFYILTVEYSQFMGDTAPASIQWIPWLPAAAGLTLLGGIVSCRFFGYHESR